MTGSDTYSVQTPYYEVEITRTVTYKAMAHVEAEDENDALPKIEDLVAQGKITLEQTDDFTDIGPIWDIELEHKIAKEQA